jgi:hypothetical protein
MILTRVSSPRRPGFRRPAVLVDDELAAWSGLLDTVSAQDGTAIVTIVRWWPRDTDLAEVRDADALAKLPEADGKDWQALLSAQVDALIRTAGEAKPRRIRASLRVGIPDRKCRAGTS